MGMSAGGNGHKAEINVTPMIDVLLVLIIIFMVIAPVAPRGMDALAPPQASTTPAPDAVSREIVISLAMDGAIDINRQSVESSALPGKLAELYRRHINDHVFVRGDGALEYSAVAHVIDLARGAGWERIGLMTR
jgi:biopolymer transport protein ExbD